MLLSTFINGLLPVLEGSLTMKLFPALKMVFSPFRGYVTFLHLSDDDPEEAAAISDSLLCPLESARNKA